MDVGVMLSDGIVKPYLYELAADGDSFETEKSDSYS